MIYVNKVKKYTKPKIVIETPKTAEENTATVAENATVEPVKTESRRGRKAKDKE